MSHVFDGNVEHVAPNLSQEVRTSIKNKSKLKAENSVRDYACSGCEKYVAFRTTALCMTDTRSQGCIETLRVQWM
jgi:hypothetical protein